MPTLDGCPLKADLIAHVCDEVIARPRRAFPSVCVADRVGHPVQHERQRTARGQGVDRRRHNGWRCLRGSTEVSREIHAAIVSQRGLGLALATLARRSAVPVRLDVAVERRLPRSVEVAAYYVVAEALTNTAKYAHASEIRVRVATEGPNLHLSIGDDGVGGADVGKGSGLNDRVEALGGYMEISSPVGSGTSLRAEEPVTGLSPRSSTHQCQRAAPRVRGSHRTVSPRHSERCSSVSFDSHRPPTRGP